MSELLPYGTVVDLSNCEREPIHVPGHIQAHGALVSLMPGTLRILRASTNTGEILGDTREWVGANARDRLPPALSDVLAGSMNRVDELEDNPRLVFGSEGDGLDVIAHFRHGELVVEFEPHPPLWPNVLEKTRDALRNLLVPQDLESFCERLATEMRALAGYDRVMIYQFAPDWHGWVRAESKRHELEPFLGLHYPASDIPAQARALFVKNPIRMLVDCRYTEMPLLPDRIDGTPLDMSHAFLRGASRMYTEYLENMGVRASLTMGLQRGQQLWGMIACHHYDAPRHLSHEQRTACELVARSASVQIAEHIAREQSGARQRRDVRHSTAVRALAAEEDLGAAIRVACEDVARLVDSSGFVAVIDGQQTRHGITPPGTFVESLVEWLGTREDVLATDHLAGFFSAASEHAGTAAGILAVPFAHSPGSWAIWFRPEQARVVTWAGNPDKPVEVGPLGDRLTPRKSFELWTQTVAGRSNEWEAGAIDAATRLRVATGDVLYRDRSRAREAAAELERRTEAMDAFGALVSHDLREPLRAIANYARFLHEDAAERLGEDVAHVEHIQRLTRRMTALIEGLLAHSRIGGAPIRADVVDLHDTARNVVLDFRERIEESGATIQIAEGLPRISGWELGYREILANLVGNALKYSDGPPHIEIGTTLRNDERVVFVRDRGIGISEKHFESVFQVFQRLHPDGRYGEGTGTGLPIVRKLVERLGGRVWVESAPGEGSTFLFTVRDAEPS